METFDLPDDGAHIAARALRIEWTDEVCYLTIHEEGDPETPVETIAVPHELAPQVAAALAPEQIQALREFAHVAWVGCLRETAGPSWCARKKGPCRSE